MKVTDLLTLDSFIKSIAESLPAIKQYVPLSNGEKAINEIESYYTNKYAGTTAFFQVAETVPKEKLVTFQCSLTIASKPTNTSTRAGLETRNFTLTLMLELLGKLLEAADESNETVEDEGDMYELVIEPAKRIFPIGLLANVNLEGHYIDLDITVPIKHLLYPV